jgi:hypothetical protein
MKAGVLIGSHFFDGTHARSDMDFCFEDTPEMHTFLQHTGFQRVYEYRGPQQEQSYWRNGHQHIDVFLARSLERRRLLRNIIRWCGLFRLILGKKDRQKVWWVMGVCIERLWSIWRQQELPVKGVQGNAWDEPFRD